MYERHEWVPGESITAQKLNHIEEGVDSLYNIPSTTVLIVNLVYDEEQDWYHTFDKTWQEIADAFYAGLNVIIKVPIRNSSSSYEYARVAGVTSGYVSLLGSDIFVYTVLPSGREWAYIDPKFYALLPSDYPTSDESEILPDDDSEPIIL